TKGKRPDDKDVTQHHRGDQRPQLSAKTGQRILKCDRFLPHSRVSFEARKKGWGARVHRLMPSSSGSKRSSHSGARGLDLAARSVLRTLLASGNPTIERKA